MAIDQVELKTALQTLLSTVKFRLLARHGSSASLDLTVMKTGEIAMTTDTQEVFACFGDGTSKQILKGDTGAVGTSFRIMGAWNSATAYVNNALYIDVVVDSVAAYYCKVSNTNHAVTNASYWGLIVDTSAIITAEGLRVTAESGRVTSEGLRVTADGGRTTAEGLRVTADGLRTTAETGRSSAEGSRVTAEGLRVTADSGRTTAEVLRVTADGNRTTAEGLRVTADSGRTTAENGRVSAENIRVTSESARALFEAYSAAHAYVIGNKVSYLGSSYQCILASTGNLPTNTTYWILIASKGTDGTGTGDMLASDYVKGTGSANTSKVDHAIYADAVALDCTKEVPYGGTTTGSANTYAISAPTITALAAGMAVCIKINVESTAASTLNWNSKGAKSIKKANGTSVTNLKSGGIYTLRYDGTNFILQGEEASGTAVASDLITGKTASTDAGDITGTMTNNGAVAITPGVSSQAIVAGYHNGSGSVAGDTDLVAANIASGINIFGVVGSLVGAPAHNSQSYTTPGTFTFTVPANVNQIMFMVVGGGGGGGGSSGGYTGGGGGGGGFYIAVLTTTPGGTISVIVGSAGIAGTGTSNGGNGGNSSLSTYFGNGGNGGISGWNNGAGGTGGTGGGYGGTGGQGSKGGLSVSGVIGGGTACGGTGGANDAAGSAGKVIILW